MARPAVRKSSPSGSAGLSGWRGAAGWTLAEGSVDIVTATAGAGARAQEATIDEITAAANTAQRCGYMSSPRRTDSSTLERTMYSLSYVLNRLSNRIRIAVCTLRPREEVRLG